MSTGVIYYSDNSVGEPIRSLVQQTIAAAGLPIVSVTLKPMDFGHNIVMEGQPGYLTMCRQILRGLEESETRTVYFCEHDVLYHPSHFDYPALRPAPGCWYYNEHVWRWDYPHDRLVTYDGLLSLSGLWAHREYALEHYRKRLAFIHEQGWDQEPSRDPGWARQMGYEPGLKSRRRGGFFDEVASIWRSVYPLIDIRHSRTFSPRKVTLDSFRHQPTGWRETTLDQIPGWDLKEMFGL